MTRVLFVTWDGGGNAPPAMEMANELLASCAEVRFLGHESQRSFIEAAGFAFEAYTSAAEVVGAHTVARTARATCLRRSIHRSRHRA